MVLRKIVSGGQSGVDRGALDASIAAGLDHGGWCPRGRKAEDGPIPAQYQLIELPSSSYAARTERNVVESDGTLVLAWGKPAGGTRLTQRLAARLGKPSLLVDLGDVQSAAGGESEPDVADSQLAPTDRQLDAVLTWIGRSSIEVLNVAGPRESQSPGIQKRAERFITRLIARSRNM